jgi:hypothetical protein
MTMKKKQRVSPREALRRLVNFLEMDSSLYDGDDDGTLGRLMYTAKRALKPLRRRRKGCKKRQRLSVQPQQGGPLWGPI